MICQRVYLAIGLAAGAAFWSHAAAAQTDDPAAAAQAGPPGAAPQEVDHSEPAPTNTVGPKVIVDVDLTTQRMQVQFPDGTDETWPISSGRPGLDTPDGEYKPQWVDPDHVSKQYQDAPMPYAIFFDLKGHAIHGSYQKVFGAAVSHGCVRLPVADAKRLYEAVMASGAEIEITGRARRRGGTYWAQRQGPPQAAYGYGYGGYGYQRSPYPPYPGRPAYPPQQSFFGALFGGH